MLDPRPSRSGAAAGRAHSDDGCDHLLYARARPHTIGWFFAVSPQGQFLEGGAFDTEGNLWFVAIGTGWVCYLTPDGKLVPGFNCNPPPELGQTCEPQGTQPRPEHQLVAEHVDRVGLPRPGLTGEPPLAALPVGDLRRVLAGHHPVDAFLACIGIVAYPAAPSGCRPAQMRLKTPRFQDFPHWMECINRAAPVHLHRHGSQGAAATRWLRQQISAGIRQWACELTRQAPDRRYKIKLPRLIPSTAAWRLNGSSWPRSIIALRSDARPCRAPGWLGALLLAVFVSAMLDPRPSRSGAAAGRAHSDDGCDHLLYARARPHTIGWFFAVSPQGQFLEGGAFDTEGNLWFVAIGTGWVCYRLRTENLSRVSTATRRLNWVRPANRKAHSRGLNTSLSLSTLTASGCRGLASPASHHSPRSQ